MKPKSPSGGPGKISVASRAWLAARPVLLESETMSTAANVLAARGFSAAEFRRATREAVAAAITAAEDELEMLRQTRQVEGWRLLLRTQRRLCEG